jgi:hypothetical protein
MILNSKIYADVTTKCRAQSLRPVCSFVVAPALPKYLFHQRNVHFKIKMVLFEICCLCIGISVYKKLFLSHVF